MGGMPDGPVRGAVKKLLRFLYLLDVRAFRAIARVRGQDRYQLRGQCERCAKCCEEPSLEVSWLVWHVPLLRFLFVQWQWHVNRFRHLRSDADTSTLVFTCAHFDRVTRRCDSYETRPGICFDYPRYELDRAWPELFEQCGYRAVAKGGTSLARALDAADLTPEQRDKLKRRLHLVE